MKPRPRGVWARYQPMVRQFARQTGLFIARRKVLLFIFAFLVTLSFFTAVPGLPHVSIGGPKYVIVLGANKGGGVQQWKGAKEWDLERTSIQNKKEYVSRHGYHLAIKDMIAKRRYAHEWRESWQKVDLIRQAMRQFPKAEWFWWMDLESYIMEPQKSLEGVLFNHLDRLERNLTYYNPTGMELDIPFVDNSQPIDLIITQDCGGFSLGSFFIRRSEWTDMLLDVWWDPVMYEQKHMEWVHGEQAALEYLYRTQPWIRSRVAFAPLRQFNAFPPGACADQANDPRFFYNSKDRDFVVNMAGCQFGRDCWQEMEDFKALSASKHKKRFYFF